MKYVLVALLLIGCSSAGNEKRLKIDENGRYIEFTSGEPFLWIGDTAWDLFHDLNGEEATYYLENRAEKKFTVIQAVVLAENDGLRKPNAYGEVPLIDLDPTKPNEAYLKHVDFIVNKAEELGLYIGMLPTWGDKVFSENPGAGPVIFNKNNAAVYGEFLGKRYKDKPIIWILGGDRNPANDDVMEIWEAMALGLKKGDGGIHLITYHPRGASSSSTFFHNKDWLDVNMYQSGHSKHFESVYRYAENDRTKTPAKPTIEGEPGYEDIAIEFWQFMDFSKPSEQRVSRGVLDEDYLIKDKSHFKKGFFTEDDVRVSAYWNLLSGAAGYTYGNNAVWQMFRKGGEVAIPALFDWKKSLDRPGANDMRHVHELFTKRPFNKLVPDQTLILGDNPKGSTYILAAQANDQSFCIFYASVGQLIPVDLSKMGDSIDAFWFDPRDGTVRAANFPENGSSFIPPTSGKGNDWVLILDNPSVNLPEL
tara:strand:- start:33107 stop:34540 length:1434 start_codon:yes stop_codon:yes gene_type:complete